MVFHIGYDAIHDNVSSIPPAAPVVMGYDTGTPDIKWTQADWSRFATTRKVHIDQGADGSPVPASTVRDVETGAWSPEAAVNNTESWKADRPTIYCNENTLPRVLAAGWQGDLWLAILTSQPPVIPPVIPGCEVVAVQFRFAGNYDMSVVFDPYWPGKRPIMTGITYPAPEKLAETASIDLAWSAVAPVDGKPPASYQVAFLGLDGRTYLEMTVDGTEVTAHGLTPGWTYNVHVWANGGDNAPPHASIIVHT